jgi:hypothetical protein
LHIEELHNLNSFPDIMIIKSRKMKWTGSIARVREMRNTHKIVIGKAEGKEHSHNLGVHKAVPLYATEALGGKGCIAPTHS